MKWKGGWVAARNRSCFLFLWYIIVTENLPNHLSVISWFWKISINRERLQFETKLLTWHVESKGGKYKKKNRQFVYYLFLLHTRFRFFGVRNMGVFKKMKNAKLKKQKRTIRKVFDFLILTKKSFTNVLPLWEKKTYLKWKGNQKISK